MGLRRDYRPGEGPMRGVVYALLFSIPVWIGIGIAVWYFWPFH